MMPAKTWCPRCKGIAEENPPPNPMWQFSCQNCGMNFDRGAVFMASDDGKPTAGETKAKDLTPMLSSTDVAHLSLRPGDVLVVTVPNETQPDGMLNLSKHLLEILPPGIKFWIKPEHVSVTVLSADRLEDAEPIPTENV